MVRKCVPRPFSDFAQIGECVDLLIKQETIEGAAFFAVLVRHERAEMLRDSTASQPIYPLSAEVNPPRITLFALG